MCAIDWSLTANVVAALSALGTLIVAIIALLAWRWPSQSAIAHDIEVTARDLREAFYEARVPIIEAGEWPDGYLAEDSIRKLSTGEQGDAFWHVYQNRLRYMKPFQEALAKIRGKAGAAFGDKVVAAIVDVALASRRLESHMRNDAKRRSEGEESEQLWGDQEYLREVKENTLIAFRGPRDDRLSRDFERAFSELLAQLRPHR